MAEPNHSIDDASAVHSLSPVTSGIGDDSLVFDSRLPVGTCVLVSDAPEATVEVGVSDEHRSPVGAYIYAGGAFGTGGLRRVRHHRRVAAGDYDARHWHIDYPDDHPSVDLARVVCVTDRDVECAVATELASSPGSASISDFGSSDYPCDAHLARGNSVETVTLFTKAAFRSKM